VVVVYESNPFGRNLSLTYCSKQKKQKNKNKSPNPKINSTKLFFFKKKKKLNKKKGYGRGFLSLLIQKKEEVDNPINEKRVNSPAINSNQTKTVLK
jgi:hypothetical protein